MRQIILIVGFLLLLTPAGMAQADSAPVNRKSGVERKMIEIKKIVTLSPAQEQALKAAYTINQQQSDSILFEVTDPTQAVIGKYQADKELKEKLMSILTEQQQIEYHTIMGTPDVMAKTEAKVQLLRESGQYSEQELSQKQNEIFDYLMAEKIVYLRDKFNVAKQRDNLQRLKKSQPASLRESDMRERMKVSGRVDNGKIKW